MNNELGFNFNAIIAKLLETLKNVVGTENDTYADGSLVGLALRNENHQHSVGLVYPNLADPILVLAGIGDWNLGNFVEIIPENEIDDHFDIHYCNIFDPSATDKFQVNLYKGTLGNEELISSFQVSREANQSGAPSKKILTPILDPNERISCKIASETGNDSLEISLEYHLY